MERWAVPRRYQLTSRDISLLRDLARFRYITASQASRLHFGHLKLAQRRLRKLARMELLRRFQLGAPHALPDQRWFYALSAHGAKLLQKTADGGNRGGFLVKRLPRNSGYLAHHEQLIDFWIWISEACFTNPSGFSCGFVPAFEHTHDRTSLRRRIAIDLDHGLGTYIPDAVLSLNRSDGVSALLLLEIDRGTEPLNRSSGSSVLLKLRSFAAAFDQGFDPYKKLFGRDYTGARLLWIVPDTRRLDSVLELATCQDLEQVVWVAPSTCLGSPGGLDSRTWAVCGRQGLHRLDE